MIWIYTLEMFAAVFFVFFGWSHVREGDVTPLYVIALLAGLGLELHAFMAMLPLLLGEA